MTPAAYQLIPCSMNRVARIIVAAVVSLRMNTAAVAAVNALSVITANVAANAEEKMTTSEPEYRQVSGAIGEIGTGGQRESAKAVLRERARRLVEEASRMRAFADILPDDLPEAVDYQVWLMVICGRGIR